MKLEKTYQELPDYFFQKTNPLPVSHPQIIIFNQKLAAQFGLQITNVAQTLSGNQLLPDSEPIAQAYAGHQFGHFNNLGDGRAHLLGEFIDPQNSQKRFDLQLKGSGPSAFSRRGDGRAALGPMLREYLISEAMAALKVPTTRSLAVIATGENIRRESLLPGAILTRIAASHIRVGTFEYALATNGPQAVKKLADYSIQRHYQKEVQLSSDNQNPYLLFLNSVLDRQAELVAQWMQLGFIHGVMNTDNMAISGETIDYGPCAFMDVYSPQTVFSSIDRNGRYAYGNQPAMAKWNLTRLAETLAPLLDTDQTKAAELANNSLDNFSEKFEKYYFKCLRAKLGFSEEKKDDEILFSRLFELMQNSQADYTQTFYFLSRPEIQSDSFFKTDAFQKWNQAWQHRLTLENKTIAEAQALMNNSNPVIIPRNYWVEEALKLAVEKNDLTLFNELLTALQIPFAESNFKTKFFAAPEGHSQNYKTFCGT